MAFLTIFCLILKAFIWSDLLTLFSTTVRTAFVAVPNFRKGSFWIANGRKPTFPCIFIMIMTKTNPLGNMRHFARLNSTSHAIFSFLKQQKEGVKCVWNVGNCLPFVTFLLKETNFTRFHICFAPRCAFLCLEMQCLLQNWNKIEEVDDMKKIGS